MRRLIALTIMFLSTSAIAEDWVAVRKPTDPGQLGTPAILVDTTSIEILDSGLRTARSKFDWSVAHKFETPSSNDVMMMILVKSYDCDKQLTRTDSIEFYSSAGSHHSAPQNPNWYPAPANKFADPTIDFVCGWRPK